MKYERLVFEDFPPKPTCILQNVFGIASVRMFYQRQEYHYSKHQKRALNTTTTSDDGLDIYYNAG
jgi:hypothetical protein